MAINDPLLFTRPMTREDIPELVALDAASNPQPWSAAMFERELDLALSLHEVVISHGKPIAFGVAWAVQDTAQLLQIAVAPAFRNQGVGQNLLDHLRELARQKGCRRMELEVNENNLPARSLYEKNGFKTVGLRKGFYNGADPAVLMECDLL